LPGIIGPFGQSGVVQSHEGVTDFKTKGLLPVFLKTKSILASDFFAMSRNYELF